MNILADWKHVKLIGDGSSIKDVIHDFVASPPLEVPQHIVDLDDVIEKHFNWLKKMPRVIPYYAVKCNDEPAILHTLMTLGTGFDCASKGEIEKVMKLGVKPENIIFAQPAKSVPSLQYAKEMQVSTMTFDGFVELEKIQVCYPEANLVLRIRCDAKDAKAALGKKFGCDPVHEAPELLEYAMKLGLNVVGISFHVGSAGTDYDIFYEAIRIARGLFDRAKLIGYELWLLDIGGGFPGDTDKPIDKYADAVNRGLEKFFPMKLNVRVIAEPGRYYVASAVTLVANVQSKRVIKELSDAGDEVLRFMYFLNDGIYGSFFCAAFEDQKVIPILKKEGELRRSTLWGPTCDALDLIIRDIDLPELNIGDRILFENLGAYGQSIAREFNGFAKPTVNVYLRESTEKMIQDLSTVGDINFKGMTNGNRIKMSQFDAK